MLSHMILLHILINVQFTDSHAGTAVFFNKRSQVDCWSDDDIAQLRARKSFEQLIPHVSPDDVDAKLIKDVLQYFRTALYTLDKDTDPRIYKLLQEAIADTIGAHLRNEILPAVRFAYYAGYVPYRNARQIHNLLDDIKTYLNTQGQGWNKPKRTSQKWANLTVAKILIGAGSLFDPCACLITKRDANSCIHLPIPKHDDVREPTVVALPLKSGGLVNLVAPESNNVLLKYYTTASRCILSSSPDKCRHSDFVSFNNDLWHWMKRDVAPHLIDEKLYSAYGGVLRIAAAVQNYGKGLSRRNLFYYETPVDSGWNPWKRIAESYIYINTDWTPTVYVVVVLLTAFSIYLVQICYTYICGDTGGCKCKSEMDPSLASIEKVESPCALETKMVERSLTMIPPQRSTAFYTSKKCEKYALKSASVGTVRTEKVYDLNDETEKMMEIVMSDNEESLIAEITSSSSEEEGETGAQGGARRKRGPSPPKLDASVSELTVSRAPSGAPAPAPLYSASTTTRTLTGSSRGRRASDSVWSESGSSSCSRSGTSTSSKSRRSRDLAWARRVISKHSLRNATTTSRTELDQTSYTTPSTQR